MLTVTECKDLGKQIQFLIKKLNQRGSEGMNISDVATGNIDGQDVISTRLVPFRNIQELQQRNQELIRVVRQLSIEKDEFAQQKYNERLQQAMQELTQLREARK